MFIVTELMHCDLYTALLQDFSPDEERLLSWHWRCIHLVIILEERVAMRMRQLSCCAPVSTVNTRGAHHENYDSCIHIAQVSPIPQAAWSCHRGRKVALDIIKGLEHIHRCNVLHLDVKVRWCLLCI